MTTLSNESASTKIKSKLVSKPGFAEATMLLRKITEGVQRITAEQRFPLTPRNKMYKYPHLKQRMIEFQEYNTELPMALFHRNWCKHIGGIVVPWNRVNGNIHLYLMDDGLLSKSLPRVPELVYEQRSAFFLNRVFGLEIPEQRKKGRIHLHVFDIHDLSEYSAMGIKKLIAKDHESRGKFMEAATMIAFSLREHCPDGGKILDFTELATNRPKWFTEMFPVWLSSR